MQRIITTPMCKDVVDIAGIKDYTLVKPNSIKDADVAILLSETESMIPKIPVKLNTYTQIRDSVYLLKDKFNTDIDKKSMDEIERLIKQNNKKRKSNSSINVKVYSEFLKDIVVDMGFNITNKHYDYVVMPDYILKDNTTDAIIIPTHSNVSKNVINRVKNRYDILEEKICMKQ